MKENQKNQPGNTGQDRKNNEWNEKSPISGKNANKDVNDEQSGIDEEENKNQPYSERDRDREQRNLRSGSEGTRSGGSGQGM